MKRRWTRDTSERESGSPELITCYTPHTSAHIHSCYYSTQYSRIFLCMACSPAPMSMPIIIPHGKGDHLPAFRCPASFFTADGPLS